MITSNVADVSKSLDKFANNAVSQIDFNKIGSTVIDMIIKRTLSGNDVNGSAFKPYSKQYAKSKSRKHGSALVNLKDGDNMLRSIVSVADKDSATIFFGNSWDNKKAGWHNDGIGNMPERKFFGLDDDINNEILKIAKKNLSVLINKL